MTDTTGPGRPGIGPQTTLRLSEDLTAKLDERATLDGTSRAEVIRRALTPLYGSAESAEELHGRAADALWQAWQASAANAAAHGVATEDVAAEWHGILHWLNTEVDRLDERAEDIQDEDDTVLGLPATHTHLSGEFYAVITQAAIYKSLRDRLVDHVERLEASES